MIEQIEKGWPGLAQEVTQLCNYLHLPNVTSGCIPKLKWKRQVKDRVREKCQEEIKATMKERTKQKKMAEEEFG